MERRHLVITENANGMGGLLRKIRVATALMVLFAVFHPSIAKAQTQQYNQTVYQDFVKQCIGPAV